MRKLLGVSSYVLVGAMVSCAPDVDLNSRPLFANSINTLTFLVYDGVTGAPVTNATLSASLGGYTLTPSKTTNNAYVIAQVPYSPGQGSMLLDVQAPGYLQTTGLPTAECTGSFNSTTSQCFKSYAVALYPNKAVGQDVTVKAFTGNDGTAVTTGSVTATLVANPALFGNVNFTVPFLPTLNARPNAIFASLGANGTAILPKDQLVLGGTYNINVYGVTDSSGRYLNPALNRTFVAGQEFPQLTLFVGAPAVTPTAVSATNEKATTVSPSLVVRFPYPVQVCSEPAVQTWSLTTGSDGNGNGTRAAPAALPNQVSTSVSEGTLTITPNFASGTGQFEAADGTQEVTFGGIKVSVVGGSGCVPLSSVTLRGGASVSTTLRIAGPTT